ncbi:unnamed protein product [Microthlaspi erraticum]|uniref:Uncharacterized protein n=1 Tax=Microthlaspi erraticum TaxID=1685480 RepID=A0A6D2J4P1_9BRAS|nr:unnamed protein product [Microthlaspi erraticum]
MEVIDKWVAEFFIRRQQNPKVPPITLLSALKFGDSPECLNLKISSVLRDISSSLIRGTVGEGTLDLLETLEKLLLQQHSSLMESHKTAYCWMAAECTLRFMWPLSAWEGVFTDAIERIWTNRIGVLKESGSGLVTDELLKWETDLTTAVVDPEFYHRIRVTNIRYTAVSFLTQFLKEQWALLGSSSLESEAQRRFLKRKAENHLEGDCVDNRKDPSDVDESTRLLEDDTIDDVSERRGTGEGKDGNEKDRDVEEVGSLENDKVIEQHASEEEQTMSTQEEEDEPSLDKVIEQHALEEEQTMSSEEEEHEPSLDDEGDKTAARELKDYLLEIQAHIDGSTRKGQEPNNDTVIEEHAADEEQEPSIEIDHSVDVTPQVNRIGTRSQDHKEEPDNVNAKASGSQGTWSGRIRPRLPSPLPLYVSPLKKATSPVRRPKKFWTPEEVEALREGVKDFGKSWKDIKNANPAVFAERTEVDLKDKWRNLVR